MKQEQSAQDFSSMNAEDVGNKQSSALIRRFSLERTPFYVVIKDQKKWFICFAEYKLTNELDVPKFDQDIWEKPEWLEALMTTHAHDYLNENMWEMVLYFSGAINHKLEFLTKGRSAEDLESLAEQL